jgi:hypothetical protein
MKKAKKSFAGRDDLLPVGGRALRVGRCAQSSADACIDADSFGEETIAFVVGLRRSLGPMKGMRGFDSFGG